MKTPHITLLVITALLGSLHARLIPGSQVALRGSNGRYVSSENGSSPMSCNRTVAYSWENSSLSTLATGESRSKEATAYTSALKTDQIP